MGHTGKLNVPIRWNPFYHVERSEHQHFSTGKVLRVSSSAKMKNSVMRLRKAKRWGKEHMSSPAESRENYPPSWKSSLR